MPETNQDRAIGRLEGKLDAFIAEIANGNSSRARMHEKIDRIGSDVRDLTSHFDALTARVAALEPDVFDYRTKRQQVDGAGKLGRFLWWLGGVILATAAWLVGTMGWLRSPHP